MIVKKSKWNRAVRAQLSRALARNQFSPRNHQLQGIQESAHAGVAQAQVALLLALVVWTSGLVDHIAPEFAKNP